MHFRIITTGRHHSSFVCQLDMSQYSKHPSTGHSKFKLKKTCLVSEFLMVQPIMWQTPSELSSKCFYLKWIKLTIQNPDVLVWFFNDEIPNGNHSKTEVKDVWISNDSKFWMSGFRIPTVWAVGCIPSSSN